MIFRWLDQTTHVIEAGQSLGGKKNRYVGLVIDNFEFMVRLSCYIIYHQLVDIDAPQNKEESFHCTDIAVPYNISQFFWLTY
jgi:hypothetical protein